MIVVFFVAVSPSVEDDCRLRLSLVVGPGHVEEAHDHVAEGYTSETYSGGDPQVCHSVLTSIGNQHTLLHCGNSSDRNASCGM